MDRNYKNIKTLYKCIMANASAIWQQAALTTYQLSSPSCSTSYTKNLLNKLYKKRLTLNGKMFESFLEKSQENGPLAEKGQDRKDKRTKQKDKRGIK